MHWEVLVAAALALGAATGIFARVGQLVFTSISAPRESQSEVSEVVNFVVPSPPLPAPATTRARRAVGAPLASRPTAGSISAPFPEAPALPADSTNRDPMRDTASRPLPPPIVA